MNAVSSYSISQHRKRTQRLSKLSDRALPYFLFVNEDFAVLLSVGMFYVYVNGITGTVFSGALSLNIIYF